MMRKPSQRRRMRLLVLETAVLFNYVGIVLSAGEVLGVEVTNASALNVTDSRSDSFPDIIDRALEKEFPENDDQATGWDVSCTNRRIEGKLYLLLLGTTALSLVTTPLLFKIIPSVVHLGVLLRWFSPDVPSEIGFKGDVLHTDSGMRNALMVQAVHVS